LEEASKMGNLKDLFASMEAAVNIVQDEDNCNTDTRPHCDERPDLKEPECKGEGFESPLPEPECSEEELAEKATNE